MDWIRQYLMQSQVSLYAPFFVFAFFLPPPPPPPHKLIGVKGRVILVAWLSAYFLNTTYRVVLQALGISHSKLSTMWYRCDIVGFGYLLVSAFRVKYFRKKSSSRITCLSGFRSNHDCNLEGFLSRCQQNGIKLNSQKLELKAKEVQFHSMVTWFLLKNTPTLIQDKRL